MSARNAHADLDGDAGLGEQSDALIERIMPLLAGQTAELQGAVLADLTAIWIAGHPDEHGRAEGDWFREQLLTLHADHVRQLVAMYLEGVDG